MSNTDPRQAYAEAIAAEISAAADALICHHAGEPADVPPYVIAVEPYGAPDGLDHAGLVGRVLREHEGKAR